MRVLVCGGRDFKDWEKLKDTLNQIDQDPGISLIIHGGARGADELADRWAMESGSAIKVFYAQWDLRGRFAGMIRNQQMLKEGKPDLVVAFPGGRGTADMVRRAKAAGVKVIEVQ